MDHGLPWLKGRHRRIPLVSIVVLAVCAAISAPAAHADAAADNQATAQSDAAAQLGTLNLPPDASMAPGEPANDQGGLAQPVLGRPATPNVVDDTGWWIVSESPSAVLTFVSSHPPAGNSPSASGSLGNTHTGLSVTAVGFSLPAIPYVLDQRQLQVAVEALPDGTTAVRTDAVDVWMTPRPSTEIVPPDAQSITAIATRYGTTQAQATVTSASQIDAATTLVNSLPASQPGARSCPAGDGTEVALSFSYPGDSAPGAVATFDWYGCASVALALDGVAQPGLTSQPFSGSGLPASPSVEDQLNTIFGVNFDPNPTFGTPVGTPQPYPIAPTPSSPGTTASPPPATTTTTPPTAPAPATRPRLGTLSGTVTVLQGAMPASQRHRRFAPVVVRVVTTRGRRVARRVVAIGQRFRIRLAPGRYVLKTSDPGCHPRTATVVAGQSTRVTLTIGCTRP